MQYLTKLVNGLMKKSWYVKEDAVDCHMKLVAMKVL